ncbi:MAG: hypothetical protein Q8Q63_07135 [Phaeovulum sp.]|nr:hypothetical protein [Phaeovulum sp.]MDP3861342.1 hypothetical protein [Phaeovulum sp.]
MTDKRVEFIARTVATLCGTPDATRLAEALRSRGEVAAFLDDVR